MKVIKKMLVCFSLCLVMGMYIPVSAQAACNHANLPRTEGELKVGTCTFEYRKISTCPSCKRVIYYELVKGPYVRHSYYSSTTSYRTANGRTVKVTKYTCSACGHVYSTSTVH